jgi:FHS family glucose/mannose:H+ symporter-like MFS transporter
MPRLEPHRVGHLSAAAYAGMFVFGIVMALLGAVLPALAGQMAFEVADIGSLFVFMNGSMLAASLVLGLAMDRFGMKPPLALGALLVALALTIIAYADTFSDLLGAVVLLGIGGGALNGATNTLVADLHDDPQRKNAALNTLGVFFGFGALLLPFALGSLAARFSFSALLLVSAALCFATGAFAGALRFPAPKQAHRLPISDMPRFLREPLVLALGCMLFFESGVEFTLGGFISTYLTRDMGVSVSLASWVLAGYWASIMLARIVLGRSRIGARPYQLLAMCALGAIAGALIGAIASGPALAAVGMLITGVSLAGIFPAALGIAGTKFQTHSGTVFGILFAVALSGGMTLPWVAGQIGSVAGLRWVFVLVAVSYLVILILSRGAARLQFGAGDRSPAVLANR